MSKLIVLLISILSFPIETYAGSRIRILNWWDYLSDKSINELKKKGFEIEISTYRTNEDAIAEIANPQSDYDVAIISNLVFPIVKHHIADDIGIRINKLRQKEYHPIFYRGCVPYFWGVMVFTFPSEFKGRVNSLNSLIKWGTSGPKSNIGIFDDPYETLIRYNLDYGNDPSTKPLFLAHPIFLKSSYFLSDTLALFDRKLPAFSYGWHGEAAKGVSKSKTTYAFSLGKNKVVLGYDMVCSMRRKHQNTEHVEIFVELLTSRSITNFNMMDNQSFSPYINQTQTLGVFSKSILEETKKHLISGRYKVIVPFDVDKQHQINKWWKPIRYEQK